MTCEGHALELVGKTGLHKCTLVHGRMQCCSLACCCLQVSLLRLVYKQVGAAMCLPSIALIVRGLVGGFCRSVLQAAELPRTVLLAWQDKGSP